MARPLAFLALLAVLIASPAAGLVLCSTKNGDVKLRDTCRKKERTLDPVSLGLQGPKGDKGDQGPALVVKDSNGIVVGPFSPGTLSHPGGTVVVNVGPDILVSLPIDYFRFPLGFPEIFFERVDCIGPPLVRDVTGTMYPLTGFGVGLVNFTVVYAYGPGVTKTVNSRLTFDVGCAGGFLGGCCNQDTQTLPVQNAATFDLLDLGLVSPFHVEGP